MNNNSRSCNKSVISRRIFAFRTKTDKGGSIVIRYSNKRARVLFMIYYFTYLIF